MTDSNYLKKVIDKSGIKYKIIAKKMGITYQGLKKKIDNRTEFKASEIVVLCDILDINSVKEREKIFFATNSDLKSTNTKGEEFIEM